MAMEYFPCLQNVVASALGYKPQATRMAMSIMTWDIPTCLKDEYLTNKDFLLKTKHAKCIGTCYRSLL